MSNYGTFMLLEEIDRLDENIYFPFFVYYGVETIDYLEFILQLSTQKDTISDRQLTEIIRQKRDFAWLVNQNMTFWDVEKMFTGQEDIELLKSKYADQKCKFSSLLAIGEAVCGLLEKPTYAFSEFLKQDIYLNKTVKFLRGWGYKAKERPLYLDVSQLKQSGQWDLEEYDSLRQSDDISSIMKNIQDNIDRDILREMGKEILTKIEFFDNKISTFIHSDKINEFIKSLSELRENLTEVSFYRTYPNYYKMSDFNYYDFHMTTREELESVIGKIHTDKYPNDEIIIYTQDSKYYLYCHFSKFILSEKFIERVISCDENGKEYPECENK